MLRWVIFFAHVAYCSCLAAYEIFKGFDANMSTTAKTTNLPQSLENTIAPYNLTLEPFECPEEEQPRNLGPYEVPTQRDLVLHVRKTLSRRFDAYHRKALRFLQDIKEATRASRPLESKCRGGQKLTYRKCVKHVSQHCELLTKSIVGSLESQRHDVIGFTQGKICNLAAMKADPVQLIKILSMEEASLEFALPGFLRLLNACSFYCIRSSQYISDKKPMRHLSDQELVMKHFLKRKKYVRIFKETK